jgi:hypothetical protein
MFLLGKVLGLFLLGFVVALSEELLFLVAMFLLLVLNPSLLLLFFD